MMMINKIKNKKWKLAATNVDDDLHTDILFLRAMTGGIKEYTGIAQKEVLQISKNFTCKFYVNEESDVKTITYLSEKYFNDDSWRIGMIENIKKSSDALVSIWQSKPQIENLNMQKLLKFYKHQYDCQKILYKYSWPAEMLQVPQLGIIDKLYAILEEKDIDIQSINEDFILLTTTEEITKLFECEIRIYNLALKNRKAFANKYPDMVKDKFRFFLSSDILTEIENIKEDYGHFGYHGYASNPVPYNSAHYTDILYDFIYDDIEFNLIKNNINKHQQSLKNLNKIKKRLKLTDKELELFQTYGLIGVYKMYRRSAQLINFLYLDKIIKRLAYLSDIPEVIIRNMTPEEILSKEFNKKELSDRINGVVYYCNQSHEQILIPSKLENFEFLDTDKSIVDQTLSGRIACAGYAIGKVRLIKRMSADGHETFNQGDILVSIETDPDLVPLMKKAGAIITDQGGITSHAAIIAREFGIPCIVGTQNATSVLVEGEEVEVDANLGIIKRLSLEKK